MKTWLKIKLDSWPYRDSITFSRIRKGIVLAFLIPLLAWTISVPLTNHNISDLNETANLTIAANQTEISQTAPNMTGIGAEAATPAGEKKYTIEISGLQSDITVAENAGIHALKLEKKPDAVKKPHFQPFQYLEIFSDNLTYSSITIRIPNEWERSDLIIYHYAGEYWLPLPTTMNGSYIEAVTYSLSIFAVGSPGGINIRLFADNPAHTNDTITVSGAAYYDNSTAAAGSNVEIAPSWTGSYNLIADSQGNFIKILTAPAQPGNHTIWVNATSGSLNGSNATYIQVTNTTLYRTGASATITGSTASGMFANIGFQFPADAVPSYSGISLVPGSATSMEVKINNITVYNATTASANLNITGYLTTSNDINITTGNAVSITYNITSSFNITKTASVSGNYSSDLTITNDMDYNWNNSGITYQLPGGAYNITAWENSTNVTASSIVSGNILRINSSGIGTIYNHSARHFSINYSLMQLDLNLTASSEEAEKGENFYIAPGVYLNGSQIDTSVRVRIYRDSALVYEGNVSSVTPFAFSNNTAGAYNITAEASANVDGVQRTGSAYFYLHIKDLLFYISADPALSFRQVNITGRAHYTNGTGHAGRVNISTGSEYYNTTSNSTGYFSYSIPGRNSGTYIISANTSAGNYSASANSTFDVMDNFFYVIKGNLPTVSGDATLSPDSTLWINNTNITRAILTLTGKTTANVTYNPFPYPINYKLIPTSYGSNISGIFTLPLYPYESVDITGAFLNTTAEIKDPANTADLAFNLTIDSRQINSSIIPHGEQSFTQSDSLTGYIPAILNPGSAQIIRIYNKNVASTQQYYFSEDLMVTYTGHVSTPRHLYVKTSNNLSFARVGNFTGATLDITGFSAAANPVRINNSRTSITGYEMILQKRYTGYITHNVSEDTARYNVTDTAVFTPESNMSSVTVIIPLIQHARDVSVSANGMDMTGSATIGENMVLPLSGISSTGIINITYWTPILDITPSANNTRFNRGDTVQISANIGGGITDATVYANITKAGMPVANLTLNHTSGGVYTSDYTLSSGAALGQYNVTVWGYNATTAKDSENLSFRVRGLNITVNSGGPYIVDNNASVTGYVKDLENNSNISGAPVNITISNSTYNYTAATTTNSTGYYNLSRLVDTAGDYNITVNASDANIIGSANTTYRVKYNVSLGVLLASHNRNSSIPINITVYDRGLSPVSGATVNSTVMINGSYSYYNGTTDGNGQYNIVHSNTSMLGTYNISVNVSRSGVTGNTAGSFRISNLTVTANILAEYQPGAIVVINGTVIDDETGQKASGAAVNVTLNNGSTAAVNSTVTSSGNYSVSFTNLYAGIYTAYVDVTYNTLTGSAAPVFHIHYNTSTNVSKSIYAIGETALLNITVLDLNNTPANANVSINITKPDASIENLNGSAVNGYFNTSFSNTTLEGDYIIAVYARNATTLAHGNAANLSLRASGFVVNASFDRSPVLYRPGETVNISGLLRDTLGAGRMADVIIRINSSAASEITNTTLTGRNGSYVWNHTLPNDSVAGWYIVTVNATTPEGVTNSTTAQFEVQLNLLVNARQHYNPGDSANVTILVRNGTVPQSAAVNVTIQKFDIWNEFAGTYFDESKMNYSAPDNSTGYYLNYTQDNELLFYTTNLTRNNTWVGKAVQLNTTSLPSHFILEYEINTSGTVGYLLARPTIGNTTKNASLDFLNYSDNSQDGYSVYMNGVQRYSKQENTNDQKIRFSIEYDAGAMRFYRNGEQFYQGSFTLPAGSFIKLNGYAKNTSIGGSAYIRFDNVTLYNLSSPIPAQGAASGSGGNYTFNFTAGPTGMYRVNATSGNSSAYTTFKVRTLDITSTLFGPYNFNESTLSSSTVVPLVIYGTVKDNETKFNITGAQVNITILQSGSPYTYSATSTNSGSYVLNFTGSFNSTAHGIFNASVSVNDSGVVSLHNTSFTAYTVNQSWFDPYRDYRVPILLFNNNTGENSGTVTFNLVLPGGYSGSTAALYDIDGNPKAASIFDMGGYVNVTFIRTLSAYEGKVYYLYFERPLTSGPYTTSMSSLQSPYSVANGTVEGYAVAITQDKNMYSQGETAVLATKLRNITGDYIITSVTTAVYYPNGSVAQVNVTQANATGEVLANYTIPAIKGRFTAITNATVNGLMRMENTSFNVGDLVVNISIDKTIYNTRENVSVNVNVTGNITTSDLTLRIYDPGGIRVFEETRNTTTPASFIFTLPVSPPGNYTITAGASTGENAGYNTAVFELDQFDINTATDRAVYTTSGSISASGTTTYRGAGANASMNITVKKNFAFNPSFETDVDNNSLPDGWRGAGNGIKTQDTIPRTGTYSARILRYPANATEGEWNYSSLYTILPDTGYTFSVWVKTDNTTGGDVRLWVEWYNGTGSISTAINTRKTVWEQNGWVSLQGSASSPANADNVKVHLVSDTVGSVWFDDLSIEPENNPPVYMANITSNTSYSNTFSLANASSYILYTNGSYIANGTLSRSNTTIFTVRRLDINASAGGPFEPGAGNVTITGYATDNRTGMAISNATVYFNITYPNSTLVNYTNTTNTQGYYNHTLSTPQVSGTYLLNITVRDNQDVTGTANITFRVRLNLSVETSRTQYNPDETAQITVNVSDSITGISGGVVNITVSSPSNSTRNFSTLYWNVTDRGSGVYTANYSGTTATGIYTVNASASNGTDNGNASAAFRVRRLNIAIQNISAKVGETRSIFARVEDETNATTIANATVNITISNLTSIVNQTNTTSLNQSGYNILSQAFTGQAGRYNVTVNATDSAGITGSVVLPYVVNLSVNLTLSQTAYNPGENITAVIAVRENISTTGTAYAATVVTTLNSYNGTTISSNTTATNAGGEAVVNLTAPDDYSSYFINVTSSKSGIGGTASRLFTTSNLRIWTNKGEVLIGGSAWASDSAPEEYRNLTLKVAVLDSAGLRRTGQSLTALVYYPNGTLYGTYPLYESDKTYSTSVLFPGKSIPEGNYSFQIAEYPGTGENFSVMIWGCARCHKPNSINMHYYFHDDTGIAPSNFSINHTHRSLSNTCDWHGYGSSASCSGCHRNETGSTGGPTKCRTCHNSADHPDEGYLNDTYGADIHANINTKPGGSWYGKETACQSCHGNITDPPRVPQCNLCHPSSSGSGMQSVPGNLSGSNTTLENFEDVSDIVATSGYRFSTVSISTSTTNKSGSFSGQVDYSLGAGFGRVYIDRKNLDLTNATSISLWVYGDNSNTTMYLAINNTRSTKVSWHQSSAMQVNWAGWRKISVPIKELSQHDLIYISFADTVRIKLESESESGSSGTILIDDLKKEQTGSHTQYKEIECGLCHGGRHNLARPPNCETCHQTEGHGWPGQDKYQQANATCMNCHESGVSENLLNVSGLIEHADILSDFENDSVFTASLTNFIQSQVYYSGANNDSGNHSALLGYTGLSGYLGNSLGAANASRYKGITVVVNSSIDANTQLVLGAYTTAWYNYTIPLDRDGWREIRVLFHNSTVNESASFNATGMVSRLWLGVYGSGSTGSVYFDNLRLAVDDNYHQYEAWPCINCHTQVGNIPGVTDITSPIRECSYCHNRTEPHTKDFSKNCMYCHFDSGHGEVDSSFTDYEKASTCLKCHAMLHNFSSIHLTTSNCNNCHQQRIHGQNAQSVAYNASQHLDCERCHGKTSTGALPLERGSPASVFLRFSYTYNNESQCIFCHEDSINAYMLHTNQTVNTTNLTLVEGIRNNTICSTCHGSKSISNAFDRDELTVNDSRAEPHPIQIAGHGNVSCYKCHGHRPETLILTVGSNCVGCHQDAEELVELIPGKLNNSDLTNVTNPGASQLIVHPPQTTGHGNTSCNNCHGHSNSNLTFVGSTAVSCTSCHQNTSSIVSLLDYREPNSTRSNVTNPGGNPLYVIPPQVQGHGNASCRECHDHAPSTFSNYNFVAGSSCESCHQNTTRNVSLIENSVPASNNTLVLDNTTSSWIVRAPQVAGHGRTACSECHTHSAESLVFYGQNDRDCVLCHYNASAKSYRLQDGSFAQPTQIIPHKDLNCTECHGHTPAGMIRVFDCNICHQNTTKALSLTNTYGAGLNITSPQGEILAVQVPGLYHSNSQVAGRKWNKTTAYWTNSTSACQYCHEISRNYSLHDPLGRASTLAGSNTRNSSITGQYWCASCHYQGYSSGSVTYNDMVRVFSEASLPIPPEITSNSSYGSYTTSNDGTKYYYHDLSDYSDVGCAGCHGTSNTTKDFLHYVTVGVGGSNCLDCHDNATSKPVAFSAYGMSAHKNLNCVDCHTPRQVKNGILIGPESRVYNFSVPNNSRWLNETLNYNGSSVLNLTLYAPNLTAYYGQVNIPMPQAGNWIAIMQNTGDDARYSLSVNVSWTHPGSSPKACENCHVSDFSTAPIVFRHIPGSGNVPTNVSCVSCHARGAQAARTSTLSASHYLAVSPMDTRDCIRCHMNMTSGYGTPPDPRNHTRYTPVNMTIVSGNPWKLADNYTLTLIEATGDGAIFEFGKDGRLLKRELVAYGDVFKYETGGVGTGNISVVDLTIRRLLTAVNQSAAELSGNVLATRIHRETDNNSCYACHDSEYRTNMPDGRDYYVLDKTTENVTLALMPANFSVLDTGLLGVGEEWNIGEGYSLRVADAGIKRGNAQLQLSRNGTLIEDIIINEGNYITHEEWVSGRKINIFSAKLERIFVGTGPAVSGFRLAEYSPAGNGTVIVLSDVRLIAGEKQTRNVTTQVLQEGVLLKYLSLDDRITIGKEPSSFHVYTLTQGGYSSDCISCHTGSGIAPVKIDISGFKKGVHQGLNRNVTYTGFITDEVNKACWACHGNGSEPSEHPVSYPGNDTPKPCISCHGYSRFGAKQVYSHYPGAGISTGASCTVCHSNTLVNRTGTGGDTSHYSTRIGLLNTTDCGGCHANATNASAWGNAPLVLKHNSSNNCTLCHAGYRIATFHDKGLTITRRCEDCHVNREKADKFNISVVRTHYPGAPPGMANTFKYNNYSCRDCHNATNNTLHSSLIIREYQNVSMGNCFQCHSEEGKFPHKARVQIGVLRHGLGIRVLSGCETCHAIEGVSKFHTPSLVGKQYFSGTGNYRVECTTCHEKHEERKYQPYEDIQCVDCHSEYGAAHYGNAQIAMVKESGACLQCHNEEAETFHNLTRIVGNISDAAYEPCRTCHNDLEALKGIQNASSKILRGNMFNISSTSNSSFRTCTSCHNASGEGRFHYSSYPRGTVQNPGWNNWTAGLITGCKDCHTYQGGELPFNATNMGTEGTSPAGTAHGFAPNCTLCHGGADPVGFHSLAASGFIPRLGVTLKPESVPAGEKSMIQATVVLAPLMKVTRAEYFIDKMGGDGQGYMLEYVVGSSNTSASLLGAMVNTSDLSFGKHLIFVHVKDSSGKWSKPEIAVLTVTKPRGLEYVEILLKDIVPALILIGFIYFMWKWYR
ncbi:MAG: hypothetical protein FIB08_04105 [Candidatus Methanoperedens sp.]|nr:hypothetical protein [Candidatus Methanoperedens sp.]